MPTKSGRIDKLLQALREPVRKRAEDFVRDTGNITSELGPVIERAIQRAVTGLLSSIANGSIKATDPRLLRTLLEQDTLDYVLLVLSQTEKLEKLRRRVKSYNAVLVVGAGLSFETGIPLTSTLYDLLHFCHSKSYGGLRRDLKKCLKFKNQFKVICDSKRTGVAHRTIAANFPSSILEIVCLNWDDHIERSATDMGRAIPKVNEDRPTGSSKRFLWKFHGDVENLTRDNDRGRGGWVFPDEGGYVFDCFTRYLSTSGLKSTLFTLIIAGYGEKDEAISKRVIDLLSNVPPRPTYRIALDLDRIEDEYYVIGPADYVIPRIFAP